MHKTPVQEAYDQWAASYDSDANATRDLDARITREILGDRHYRLTIEAGCGTGKNTLFFARVSRRVVAIDFSESMLAVAKAAVTSPHVQFLQADLLHPWPCKEQSADLVSCNLVLEHIPEPTFVFAQAARVLSPGGRLFISELHPMRQSLGSKATFTHAGQQVQPPAFAHDISEFLAAGTQAGFTLLRLDQWRDNDKQDAPPRLLSILFQAR